MIPKRLRKLMAAIGCCCGFGGSGSPGPPITGSPPGGIPGTEEPCDGCTPRTNPNAPQTLIATVTVCNRTATEVRLEWDSANDMWIGSTYPFNPSPPGLPNWLGPCPTCGGMSLPPNLFACFAIVRIYCRDNKMRADITYEATGVRWVVETFIPADAFTCDPFFVHYRATVQNRPENNCHECDGSAIEITATGLV